MTEEVPKICKCCDEPIEEKRPHWECRKVLALEIIAEQLKGINERLRDGHL